MLYEPRRGLVCGGGGFNIYAVFCVVFLSTDCDIDAGASYYADD